MPFDPKAPSRFQGRRAALDGALTLDEVALRLGLEVEGVIRMTDRRHLAALMDRGDWYFPAWQFIGSGPLPGLVELLVAWSGSMVALSAWMRTPCRGLDGRTPGTAMIENDSGAVIAELVDHPPPTRKA